MASKAREIWEAAEDAYDRELNNPGSTGLSPENNAAAVIQVAIDAARADERAKTKAACAGIARRRMDERFEEFGTREPDTNACYYTGPAAEMYEALDEEADDIATAIEQWEPNT
jgi:hypothetical protein